MKNRLCNIAFDLDETCVQLLPVIDRCLEILFNDKMVKNGSYRIKTEGDLAEHSIAHAIKAAVCNVDMIKPQPGVTELFEKLYDTTGEPIMIVTNRAPSTAKHTHDLMDKICPVPFIVGFARSYNDKLSFLSHRQIFVEDRRITAKHLARNGKTVFLVDKPYNQIEIPHSNILRIKEIKELIPLVDSVLTKELY